MANSHLRYTSQDYQTKPLLVKDLVENLNSIFPD